MVKISVFLVRVLVGFEVVFSRYLNGVFIGVLEWISWVLNGCIWLFFVLFLVLVLVEFQEDLKYLLVRSSKCTV